METNIKQLKCGGCGEAKHKLYIRQNEEIIVECINCKSQSELIVPKPKIEIRNVAGLGTICNYGD